jgi:transposase
MANYRHYSIEFKRKLVEEYLSGISVHELSRRYDIGRALIRVWAQKAEAGAFSEEVVTAQTIKHYERRIEALERLAGRQALDLEFLKRALELATSRQNAMPRPVGPASRQPSGNCILWPAT